LACPFCLTKIEESNPYSVREEENPVKNETIKGQISKERVENPQVCNHYLGYLSERIQKEKIPEECLICKYTIECMLKKIRE